MLTIHSIIRNEPFVYYSIKSVYDYVDKILLYDTGSDDAYTLQDIELLLKEDVKKKIVFKQVAIDVDETKFSFETIREEMVKNKGFKGRGAVRQMQIDDTTTPFFMLVDGDEVHYQSTMEQIRDVILPTFPKDKVCCFLPLTWYFDFEHTYWCYPSSGRIFRTDKVCMFYQVPDERHMIKGGNILSKKSLEIFRAYVKPYAHFQGYLKPWKKVTTRLHLHSDPLPEVMIENDYFIKRFQCGLQ